MRNLRGFSYRFLVITIISLATSCSYLSWIGSGRRRDDASRHRAFQALEEYLAVLPMVLALNGAAQCHGDCLFAYFLIDPTDPSRKEQIESDRVCRTVLRTYYKAATSIEGFGHSPFGNYPWFGEVYEYVTQEELSPEMTQDEKMAEIDAAAIRGYETLRAGQRNNPVYALLAQGYLLMQRGFFREETAFSRWYDRQGVKLPRARTDFCTESE